MSKNLFAGVATTLVMATAAAGTVQAAPAKTNVEEAVTQAAQHDPAKEIVKTGNIVALDSKTIQTKGADGSLTITALDAANSRTRSDHSGASLFTVLKAPGKQARFNVNLPKGHYLERTEDGGLDVLTKMDSVSVVKAHINAPYAVDASGKRVATAYTVSGNTITQSVAQNATFPVAADPKIQIGWGVYVGAWGREWNNLARAVVQTGGIFVGGGCALAAWAAKSVWGRVFSTACSFLGIGSMSAIVSWLKRSSKVTAGLSPNACYQTRFPTSEGFKKVSSSKC